MAKFNWQWDGIWCSSGDPNVWTTSFTSFEAAEAKKPKDCRWGELLPSPLSHIEKEPDWAVFRDETPGERVDGWEATVEGIRLIIYNA